MRKLASRVIMLILTVSALITSASASYEYDKATGHATISGSINTVTEKAYNYVRYYIDYSEQKISEDPHFCGLSGGGQVEGIFLIKQIEFVNDISTGDYLGPGENPARLSSSVDLGYYISVGNESSYTREKKDIHYFQIENYILDQGLNIAQRATKPRSYIDREPQQLSGPSTVYEYHLRVYCSNCNAQSSRTLKVTKPNWGVETTQRSVDEVYLQPTTSPKSFTLKNVSTRNLSIKTDVPVTIDGGTYSGSPAA